MSESPTNIANYYNGWENYQALLIKGTSPHYGDDALSRQWVIWHVIEHDLHHGGEVSLMLGTHGLAAPDL